MTEQEAKDHFHLIIGYIAGFVVGVCTCSIGFWLVR